VLWQVVVRHYRVLAVCGVVSLLLAWGVGRLFAKPVYLTEAALLYQQVPLTAEQQIVYASPPSVGTLAGWVKDPQFLGGVLQELGLALPPAVFADQHLKVDQPPGTEVITVSLKWSDREASRQMLDLLLQRYIEYVVAERKRVILQRSRQAKLQELSLCESEVVRLAGNIRQLTEQLDKNKNLPVSDLDGILLARQDDLPQADDFRRPYSYLPGIMLTQRNELQERIRRQESQLIELQGEFKKQKGEYDRHRNLAQGAYPQSEVDNLGIECEKIRQKIEQAEKWLAQDREELRTLPIHQARKKQVAEQVQAAFLRREGRKLDDALQAVGALLRCR